MSKPWEEYADAETPTGAPGRPMAPWEEYQRRDAERGYDDATQKSGVVDATLRGGINAITGGFIDEFAGALSHPVGAAKAVMGRTTEELPPDVAGPAAPDPDVSAYRGERDRYRKIYKRAADEHPVATFVGNVGGAVIGPGKAMTGLKGAQAIKASGALAAVTGVGMSEAEIADGEYGRLALDTAISTGIGMATQWGANKIGDKLAARALRKAAPQTIVENTVEMIPPGPPGGGGGTTAKAADQMKRWAGQIFEEAKPVENADEVAGAVQTIAGDGYNVPGWVLTKNKPTQNLADSLLKSPTIGGKMTREEVMPIYEGLEKFGKAVAERAGGLSAHETGTAVKRGAMERFKSMIAPAEAIYEQLESKFAQVPLERTAFKRGVGKLRAKFKTDITGASQKLLDGIEETFNEVDDVQSLRQFRTNLGRYLDGNVSPAQKEIIGTMYGVLTRERDRSILRSAVTTGSKVSRTVKAKALVGDLRQADSIYRKGVTEAGEALGVAGNGKTPTSTAIRQYLDTTPAEQVVKDLFDKGDFSAMSKMQQTFPEQFKQLKDLAIQNLIKASTEGTTLSPQRLSTNLGKYGPEVQKMLLDDLMPQAEAAKLTLGAMPRNFNPSDTSTRLQFTSILSPAWWQANALSLGQRQILKTGTAKASQAAVGARTGAAASGPPGQVKIMTKVMGTPGMEKWAKQLQEAVQRGPEAWAATYYLLSTGDPKFRSMLDSKDEGQ